MTVYPHSVQTDTPTPPASLKSAMVKAIAFAKDGATQDDLDEVFKIMGTNKDQFPTIEYYDNAIAESQFIAEQISIRKSLEMLASYLFYCDNDPDPGLWDTYFIPANDQVHILHLQLAKALQS